MTTDTLARAGWIRAGRAAVVLVALIMAAISFTHIRDLALAYGGDSLTAPLLPLGIDGAVAAMTVFMHQASGLALHLARCVLMAAVGMTVACNTAYGAAFGVTGALLWSSPAVLFVGCVEVSVLMVRKTRPAAMAVRNETVTVPASKTPARVPARQRPGAKRDKAERLIAADPGVSSGRLAETVGVPRSTAARWKTAAMANGNGGHG